MADARRRFGRSVPDWGVDHLSQDATVAFVDDELSTAARQRAAAHVASCGECAAEVVAQRQVRSALRAADEPHVPSSLLSMLRAIPQEAELPPSPPGLAVTADGQVVSVLRPERMPHARTPAGPPPAASVRRTPDLSGPDLSGPDLTGPDLTGPAGLGGGHLPAPSRGRRLRAGAAAASGLALGALAFGVLPSATVAPAAPAQPDRGVLGGSVLNGGSEGAARLGTGAPFQPAAIRNETAPSAAPSTTPATPRLTSAPPGEPRTER
ncbi:anti-sigma factor family protein [Pseudonocardia sp. RS010]|uniref:anti-sigma factor family protein n=1 Tax=Pseudonocardia sp. RS010 TaxID=3385979 RepID=UPI0039A1F70D